VEWVAQVSLLRPGFLLADGLGRNTQVSEARPGPPTLSEQFGMRVAELKQKNNSRSVVVPRQIAMYLAKQMTEASLPEIFIIKYPFEDPGLTRNSPGKIVV
jgi:hypothetical protein